jgi:hypothetical protein
MVGLVHGSSALSVQSAVLQAFARLRLCIQHRKSRPNGSYRDLPGPRNCENLSSDSDQFRVIPTYSDQKNVKTRFSDLRLARPRSVVSSCVRPGQIRTKPTPLPMDFVDCQAFTSGHFIKCPDQRLSGCASGYGLDVSKQTDIPLADSAANPSQPAPECHFCL